jgi:branched-chain amino acid transport system permease protein
VFDWLSPLQIFTIDTAMITTIMVLSVHVAFRAGLFNLAPLGFGAVGAYTTALLTTEQHVPTAIGIILGVVAASVLAAIFAVPVLRLRGIYLALGTVALAQAIVVGITNFGFTNGTLGISGIPNSITTLELIILLLVLFVLLELERRSHFGRAIAAVRLDERTASGLGINVRWVRFSSFLLSAALAGLSGALEAHRTTVISPDQYAFGALIPIFVYALVGGEGHWIGPVLVCWGLITIRQYINFAGSTWENLIYGVLLIAMMMVAPSGITDPKLLRRLHFRRNRRLRQAALQASRAEATLAAAEAEEAARVVAAATAHPEGTMPLKTP